MAVVIDEPTDVLAVPAVSANARAAGSSRQTGSEEAAAELGIWLAGLESFLSSAAKAADASTEFRLLRSVVERCARLNIRLIADGTDVIGPDHAADLARELREMLQLSACMARAELIRPGEFHAWSLTLQGKLREAKAVRELIAHAERAGVDHLPEPLRSFASRKPVKTEEVAELALVLPRFGKVLLWLGVIGRMLEADEPLKPAMLIFGRVNEQVAELIGYINDRLEHFANEEAEVFGALDAASYTASIELKKVNSAEFAGLIALRPAPAIYAGIETAYSMLNDSFQQVLTGLARIVDPTVEAALLFPTSKTNFERSLVLRRELWELVQLAQAAEHEPEKRQVDALNDTLRKFMSGTVRFLYYKDTETFERFVEEIMVTKQTKDLVPILHRFGAYLETLFGQVNLRSTLEKCPFENS